MINVWDFVNAKKVKIVTLENKEYVGDVAAIFDKEETYDEEDSIDILINGNYIGFFQVK